MLEIMNPRPLHLSHNEGSDEANIGIVVKCWENARPLIRELEQTVDFAERKCGDLMQQLHLCKEYYEKWSTERFSGTPTVIHKRKPKKRFNRKPGKSQSSSDSDSQKTIPQVNNNFSEKLKSKIFEITNEIKEVNRKIVLKEPCFTISQRRSNDAVPGLISNVSSDQKITEDGREREVLRSEKTFYTSKPEPTASAVKDDGDKCEQKESTSSLKRTPSKILPKKRTPLIMRRHTSMQKYKLRSKSLPQGVRRKFGFGSFVEIVDKKLPKFNEGLMKIKSRTTVSSGSKSNCGKEGRRPKSRAVDRSRSRTVENPRSRGKGMARRSYHNKVESSKLNPNCSGDARNGGSLASEAPGSAAKKSLNQSDHAMQNARSCSNFSNEIGSRQIKLSSTYLSEDNDRRVENLIAGKTKLLIAPRQPIPFTICRTAKTFNLGLNIQQVLSLIKSKRHTSMLQAIIKENIRSSRSVPQKTDGNLNTLYIATSSRIARTADSEVCPTRDDGDHCYSVISSATGSTLKCKMLTCRPSLAEQISKEEDNLQSVTDPPTFPIVEHVKFSELQRPEDVWVVEQPDPQQSLQRFRSRCTCFPTRQSVDYHKVLKQYCRMKRCGEKSDAFRGAICTSSFPSFVMSESGFCSVPSRAQITYNDKLIGSKLELKKVQEDLDNLCRRYERVQEQLMDENVNDYEVDAELDALEMELNYREEDCKTIVNFYNQLIALKKKVGELRGKIRSSTNITEVNPKVPRSRKDPFRPTPSMTLTRVLRQIQCLQDKIKLIDSPSIT